MAEGCLHLLILILCLAVGLGVERGEEARQSSNQKAELSPEYGELGLRPKEGHGGGGRAPAGLFPWQKAA